MGTWLTENIATIIIGVLLMAAIAAILVHMIRNRKKGKLPADVAVPIAP